MLTSIFLPEPTQWQLERVEVGDQSLVIKLLTTSTQAVCPYCATSSERAHSYYWRQPADLPCFGYRVKLNLQVRRFFCDNDQCTYTTFAERIPKVIAPHARRTARLIDQQQAIAFTAGGETGARLMAQLGMPGSPDNLLRIIRDTPEPVVTTPRVLGVDDWAIRKGQSYGTILVDLEKQQPVDLLPERSAEAFAAWLKAHPGVEIISRDRASDYIKGATDGAPEATQVADRWHLLKNLREAIERYLDRDQPCLKAAADKEPVARPEPTTPELQLPEPSQPDEPEPDEEPAQSGQLTKAQQDKLARRTKRLARYEAVLELQQYGLTNNEIARRLNMDPHTVARYLKTEHCPLYPEGRTRPSKLDPYRDYISQRWQAGCHNATEIWRELGHLGFTGSRGLVAQWAARQRQQLRSSQSEPPPPKVAPWAPSRAAWLFVKPPTDLAPEDQAALARMIQTSDKAALVYHLGQQFVAMIHDRQPEALVPWLTAVFESGVGALTRLAKGIQQDFQAVEAALSLPWSNGQTEGQVNRLKLIKRQMYGRAKFDLLRKRVLQSVA